MHIKQLGIVCMAFVLAAALGCSSQRGSAGGDANMKENVSQALQQAGVRDVNVDVDREKRVVTLKGEVPSAQMKENAEQAAKASAPGHVVANELSVRPQGAEDQARKIESNVDDGIESNYKAALVGNRLDDADISYEAHNGVLTLEGTVNNAGQRQKAEKIAASVPNVQQVVNKLEVKQKGGR